MAIFSNGVVELASAIKGAQRPRFNILSMSLSKVNLIDLVKRRVGDMDLF